MTDLAPTVTFTEPLTDAEQAKVATWLHEDLQAGKITQAQFDRALQPTPAPPRRPCPVRP